VRVRVQLSSSDANTKEPLPPGMYAGSAAVM
jgi:hypothetical protein